MKKSTVLKVLLVIIVVALAAFGVFYFTNKDSKTNLDSNSNETKNNTSVANKQENIDNNIIEKGEMHTRGLFEKDGLTGSENNLLNNDMTMCKEATLYYRVISNIEDYKIYSERIDIPKMTEEDFENKALLIVSNENVREPEETDLEISDVVVNNDVTTIIMKQKENPDYESKTNVFYAIVSNSLIKDDVTIVIENNIN